MAIFVTARFTAKPGQGDALASIINDIIPLVRAENGCMKYDLHRLQGQEDTFLFYEIWESLEALKCHGEISHMQDYKTKSADMLMAPGVVELWEGVDIQG